MKLQGEHLHHCILVVYIERHNQNLAEHLRWNFLAVNYYRRTESSILDVRLDSEYISDIPVKNAAEKNKAFF